MRIIRSAVCGFCMGVKRAVELATAEADQARACGGRVFTLGPLIHNPVVLADLANRDVQTLDDPQTDLEGCSLIIRAHGLDPRLEEDLRGRGARIVDATCPKVKASQLKVKALMQDGFALFLAGEASHAEIAGILGYANAAGYGSHSDTSRFCAVVSNAAEAQAAAGRLYETDKNAKTALVAQTTICEEEYRAIGGEIKNYFPALEVVRTICAATRERQQVLRELLCKVDAVIIAGGRESANTRRLLAIAQEGGKPCALVETAACIPPAFLSYETVGLCAGASTPDTVIDEMERFLYREG